MHVSKDAELIAKQRFLGAVRKTHAVVVIRRFRRVHDDADTSAGPFENLGPDGDHENRQRDGAFHLVS